MNWLTRLKNQQHPEPDATKPTKPVLERLEGGFVGFVVPTLALAEKTRAESATTPDPDRWCWPHSTAMNTVEIDTFTGRLARFTDKGLSLDEAEVLADKLVIRDRESDDRRLCLECSNLSRTGTGWSCRNWRQAGIGAPGVPADLVRQLQRCDGFIDSSLRTAS